MQIFVINAYEDRQSKYDENYQMFPALWWEDIDDVQLDKFHFRYNCKMDLRKKITACCLSHLEMLKKIIDEDLHDVVILEDDCIIKDMELLKEVIHLLPDEFVYLGGQINAPLVKNYLSFEKKEKQNVVHSISNDNNLINCIQPETFRITHACSYYIPNKNVALKLLSSIEEVYKGRRYRAIDVMYHELQKRNIIKYFVFPALGTLYIPDAKKGFTYSHYKLNNDQSEY